MIHMSHFSEKCLKQLELATNNPSQEDISLSKSSYLHISEIMTNNSHRRKNYLKKKSELVAVGTKRRQQLKRGL